jgi:N4-gp56 family major capsid protein
MSVLTPDMVAKAVTIMKKNRVPTINGKFYAVIHPSVAYDLRKSDAWIEAHKYAAPEEVFNGEIGELHGVRFIENVFAPILKGEYVNKAGGATYATYFFGKDAFGIIDPEGGALEMIVKDKSQVGGPLNQFSTIGYKFETNGATILYPERCLRVMSCSSFSATDAEN